MLSSQRNALSSALKTCYRHLLDSIELSEQFVQSSDDARKSCVLTSLTEGQISEPDLRRLGDSLPYADDEWTYS